MRVLAIALVGLMASSGAMAATTKHRAHASPHSAHKITAPPHVIPDTGVLGPEDIVAIAKLGEIGSKDEFSDDTTLKYVGRPVSITISDDVFVTYDKDTHTLKAIALSTTGFKLASDVTHSEYVGMNGFGAKTAVSKETGSDYGFTFADAYADSGSDDGLSYSAPLDGPEAKALKDELRLRITGTVAKSDGVYAMNNSAVSNRLVYSTPTVSDPDDMMIHNFYVTIKPLRYEWFDARTGTVLKAIDIPSRDPK